MNLKKSYRIAVLLSGVIVITCLIHYMVKSREHSVNSTLDVSLKDQVSPHGASLSNTLATTSTNRADKPKKWEKPCPEVKKKHRIVIIGAGPTALGAAHRLYELGILNSDIQVIILEQQSHPGGLATSERDNQGFLWDMGGHVVFSHYTYFTQALDKAIPEWNQHVRAAYAFMKDSDGIRRFIPYPVQDNIHVMDTFNQQRCLKGLEEITLNPSHARPDNFDQWLLQNFGVGLCEVFMRKYNKKVWTVNTTEMNAVWVGERVAVPDIDKIKAKIAAAGREEEAKDSKWGPNRFFRFPRYGGTGGIWKAIAKELPQGWFHFQHKVNQIYVKDKKLKVVLLENKENYFLNYDYLISTAPLDTFLYMINDTDETSMHMKSLAKEFLYSHTHILGIGLKGLPPEILANKSWMYFPDSDSPFYRVTVFSSYSDDHVPEAGSYWSLMCEAAEAKTSDDQSYWTENNLLNKTVTALVNYGFITLEQVVSRYYHRLDHGYPVPTLKREDLLTIIQPWLQTNGIYSRGRFGGWRYEVGNQDHSFMQGVEATDLIVRKIPEETYPEPSKVNAMIGTDRNLQCSPFPSSDYNNYEFVIAHYNEDLNWLTPVADHCHIYHKGGEIIPQFKFHQWEKLRNVGREAHTYLHHIINNYHHLSDVTVFLQGDTRKHGHFCFRNISEFISQAQGKQFSCINQGRFTKWGRINHIGKWKQALMSGKMRKANQTLGDFWYSIFGYPHPEAVTLCLAGCFSATRKQIQKHPKEFYEKIFTYFSDHPDPEEGHYMERLWNAVFTYYPK